MAMAAIRIAKDSLKAEITKLTAIAKELREALEDVADMDVEDFESGGECHYQHTRNIINNAKQSLLRGEQNIKKE